MKSARLLSLALFGLLSFAVSAQCTLTVDAGPDQVLCPGANSVDLEAMVTDGQVTSVSWTPTTGLDTPSSLTTRAFPSTNITYTVEVETFNPMFNLIANGDFEAGNVGFTTDYEESTTVGPFGLLSQEGQYVISTNSRLAHVNFADCDDHTGDGQMMVVNGSGVPNENVWCQTVTVMPDTEYRFSAWLMTVVNDPNVADLQFTVNGFRLGRFQADPATCFWNEFAENWNSGTSTTAEICITNQNTAVGGNDFALDDLFFGPVCRTSDEVSIAVIDLIAQASADEELLCVGTTVLNGFGSSEGPGYTYFWQSVDGGNIVSGGTTLYPEVDATGTYVLSVRYDDGVTACPFPAQAVTVVSPPADEPTAVITPQGVLNCSTERITLSAAGSTTGPNIVYDWRTTNGGIVSGRGAEVATINLPGNYRLIVTNTDTGCFGEEVINVREDDDRPQPYIEPPLRLTCNRTQVQLDATDTEPATGLAITWEATNGGNIVSGADGLMPIVDQPGIYTLTVRDETNGCDGFTSVVVGVDDADVGLVLDVPPPLDCRNPLAFLRASSVLPGVTYRWTTRDGNLVDRANTNQPSVDAGGTYIVEATDPDTGCSQIDSVVVISNSVRPTIVIAPPREFNCDVFRQRLDATASSSGPDFQYTWLEVGGEAQIERGASTLRPRVSGAGTYSFRIFDMSNGCSRDTLITLTEDNERPIADAGPEGYLGCNNLTVTLDGSQSSQGEQYGYRWSTIGGNILTPDTLQQITVDSAGVYLLSVFDRSNGCPTVSRTRVFTYTERPEAAAAAARDLTCEATEVTLDASASLVNIDQLAQWTTADGNIVAADQSLRPTVSEPGTYQLMLTDTLSGCRDSVDVVVGIDTVRPQTEIASAPLLTCRTDTVNLSATTSANTTWTWGTNDGAFAGNVESLSPRVAAAGTYFLTVRNATNGCLATDTATVAEDRTPPQVLLGAPDPLLTCRDNSVTLGAAAGAIPGVEQRWTRSPDGTLLGQEATLDVSSVGNYRLEVINQTNGCSAADSVTVNEDIALPVATVDPVPDLNCTDRSRELLALTAAGNDYEFTWASAGGTMVTGDRVTVVAGGDYELQLLSNTNGCRDTVRVTVGQDTIRPLASILPPAVLTCRDADLDLTATADDPAGRFAYAWSTTDGSLTGPANALNTRAAAAGSYNLRVTDNANTCFTDVSTVVTEDKQLPTIAADPAGTLDCRTDTLRLRTIITTAGDDPNIRWSTADGNILSGGVSASPLIGQVGTYRILVTNPTTACADSLELTVTEDVAAPTIQLAEDLDLGCEDIPVDLAAIATGNDLTYEWSTPNGTLLEGTTTASPTIRGSGIYTLLVTDGETGCTATASLRADQQLLNGFAFTSAPPNCNDDFGRVFFGEVNGGTAPFLYSVNGGRSYGPAPTVNSLAPGTYDLRVQDANGCEQSNQVIIPDLPPLETTLEPQAEIALGESYQLNLQVNLESAINREIRWTPDTTLDCTDCVDPMASPSETTTYQATVITADGCRSTAITTIIVKDERVVYFPTAFSPNGDGNNDLFLPLGNTEQIAVVREFLIYDRWGEQVHARENFSPNDPDAGWDGRLNNQQMSSGVYVYHTVVEFVGGRVDVYSGDVTLLR